MRRLLMVFIFVAAFAIPALANQQADVMKSVNQFIDGFNKGDTKSALAVFANTVSVTDDFAPYHWEGTTAMSKWMADYGAAAKKLGLTNPVVKLGKPKHVDVVGSQAYVVTTADYTYKLKGKPVKEAGAVMTVVLHKEKASWLITAWTWAKP